MWRHSVPNALVPVSSPCSACSSPSWSPAPSSSRTSSTSPASGRLAYQALSQRDIVVMQDVVLFFAALVIIMNFIVDLSYLAIDPRLRKGQCADERVVATDDQDASSPPSCV
jgi:peptide/nickel transport system permease protein